jgi:hypothetical protein
MATNFYARAREKREDPFELGSTAGHGTAAKSAHATTGQMPPHRLVANPATRTVIARVSPTADNLGVPYFLVNITEKPYPAFQENVDPSREKQG